MAALAKRTGVLIWNSGSWQVSQPVRAWLRTCNRQVKQIGQGVRLLVSFLPGQNPWLIAIEPNRLHSRNGWLSRTGYCPLRPTRVSSSIH